MSLPSLEIKASLTSCLSKGCNLALINITASVEDDFRDSLINRSLADHFANLLGCCDVISILKCVFDLFLNGAGGYQSLLCVIINNLSIDVLIASVDSQARSLRRAAETVADPGVLCYLFLACLTDLASDVLISILDALALVRLRSSLFSDVCRILADGFFVNTLDDDHVCALHFRGNSLRVDHLNRVRIS